MEYESNLDMRRVGIPISGGTIGDVFVAASRVLSIRFEPYEGPMWFRAYGISPHEEVGWITDVRLTRGGADIYPLRSKRDTSFPIQESDIILIYIITD